MKYFGVRMVLGLVGLLLASTPLAASAAQRSVVLEDGQRVEVDGKMIKLLDGGSARRLGEAFIAGTLSSAKAAAGKSTKLKVHVESGSFASRNGTIHVVSESN